MSKRKLLLALCVAAMVTGALAFGRHTQLAVSTSASNRRTIQNDLLQSAGRGTLDAVSTQQSQQEQDKKLPEPQSEDIPEHVIYELFLREVAAFKKKADALERQGQDGRWLRAYHKQEAKLDDRQAEALDRIAARSERELTRLDRRARSITETVRARHPRGKLKEGEALPTPPDELQHLQQQRNNAVLRARDQLHADFGAAEFDRFDKHVRQDIAKKIKPIKRDKNTPDSPRGASQQSQR